MRQNNDYHPITIFVAFLYVMLIVIPLAMGLLTSGLYDKDELKKLGRPICWMFGHNWADKHEYGVEPKCLSCGKRRARTNEQS